MHAFNFKNSSNPIEDLSILSEDLENVNISLIKDEFPILLKLVDIYQKLSTMCKNKALVHPEWSLLSGRIKMRHLKNSIPKTFSESTTILKSILNQEYFEFVMKNSERLNSMIKHDRDYVYDIFAIKTLLKSYFLRIKKDSTTCILESPQYLFLRVAVYLWFYKGSDELKLEESFKNIESMYNDMSCGNYIHASPTLFNAGTHRSQLSSCFTMTTDDNMESITKSWRDAAFISMNSGGIGFDYSSLRHSEIGEFGQSGGIVPWIKVMNQILSTVDQGGKYKGAGACYITDWHIDIEEYLELRKPSCVEDIFYGMMISDLFMRRVENDEMWTLFCPRKTLDLENKWGTEFEIEYSSFEEKAISGNLNHFRRIKARKLWQKILLTQIQTDMPYILYKDAINRKSNQINLGTTRLSNLCVSGDTFVLTKNGNIQIQSLENKNIKAWNGFEWSDVTVKKTGENMKLLCIEFSNGARLKCTPDHKFYIKNKEGSCVISASDLCINDELIDFLLPPPTEFEKLKSTDPAYIYPYTQGFFHGRGKYNKYKKPVVRLDDENIILPQLSFQSFSRVEGKITKVILNNLEYSIPHTQSLLTKAVWISGFIDGCGVSKGDSIILKRGTWWCMEDFRLVCQTFDLNLNIIDEKIILRKHELSKLFKNDVYLYKFKKFMDEQYDNISEKESVKVSTVFFNASTSDTFCFMEPLNHTAVFNGIITGQCTEITLVSNNENIGSCNLGSVSLYKCVDVSSKTFDFGELERLTRCLVRNINQIIDRNYYIDNVPEIKRTNLKNRPLGIGIQSLADTFALLDMSWLTPESKKLNEMISETMYYAAISESIEISKKLGPYETFYGSPSSKGLFQFDLWDNEVLEKTFKNKMKENPSIDIEFLKKNFEKRGLCTYRYDWELLRSDMMKHGLRNSLLLAYMPTSSTSNILGTTESFEVPAQYIYTREVSSEYFTIVNKHLVKDLDEIDMWNVNVLQNIVKNEGSIQNLDYEGCEDNSKIQRLKFLKEKYLTAFEIPESCTGYVFRSRKIYLPISIF